MGYIDNLIQNCNAAKTALPLREFVMSDISDLNNINCAIYVISEIDGDAEKSFSDFARFKALKTRACAKLNSPSKTMYVGSSTTNLKNRINQHLGNGDKGTYALHLKEWFEGKYQILVKEYSITKEILQIIEDALSDELKPAFGKKGANNR